MSTRVFLAFLTVFAFGSASAQRGRPIRVEVTALRDSGGPVADASVIITKQGAGAIVMARTDSAGHATVRFPGDTGTFTLVVQRLGFTQATGPIVLDNDIKQFTVILHRLAQRLEAVHVDARATSEKYTVSAAVIASETRPLYNALDVIRKMRPEMEGDAGRLCPIIQNIWINGERVWRKLPLETPPPPIPKDTVLVTVRPEHIEEMHYANCWEEGKESAMGTFNALYINLKLGYTWDFKRGSYFIGTDTTFVRRPHD